jgi:uncharacterized NAD(P)/FAD-binding protein YdhS
MSAFAEDAGHFDRWLDTAAAHLPHELSRTEAGHFATRRLYGRYLRALLYAEMRASGGRVRLVGSEVTAISRVPEGWRLACANGHTFIARSVVLAIGNLPVRPPGDPLVFHDPWAGEAARGLRPGMPVVVVGTGLTMVDLALSMQELGFSGPVIAISRRGLLPQRHIAVTGGWATPAFTAAERGSLTALLRRVRHEVREAEGRAADWRAVIDSLRPVTASLWRELSAADRARFLRHLRPYWDVHRHRLAPPAADRLQALLRDGFLRLLRGRITAIEQHGDELRVGVHGRGASTLENIRAQRLIHATGLRNAQGTGGLIGQLYAQGLGRTDAHGLGLLVADTLEVLGRDGQPVPRLWALGPIVRGVFWECTAVPDIRVHAQLIAQRIAADQG